MNAPRRTECESKKEICNPLYDLASEDASLNDFAVPVCIHKTNDSGETEKSESECKPKKLEISRTLSQHIDYHQELPRVDCPEKIIFCIDLNTEMGKSSFRSKVGEMHSALSLIQKSLSLFIKHKLLLDQRNSFALSVLTDEVVWMQDFTHNSKEIIKALSRLQTIDIINHQQPMKSLYDLILKKVDLPHVEGDASVLPPPFVVRVILFYGRSNCLPDFMGCQINDIETCPYIFIDCIYVHEPVSPNNQCETIYDTLTNLDRHYRSYILEVARNPTRIYDHIAKLLAHPLQRVPQSDASYKLKPQNFADT